MPIARFLYGGDDEDWANWICYKHTVSLHWLNSVLWGSRAEIENLLHIMALAHVLVHIRENIHGEVCLIMTMHTEHNTQCLMHAVVFLKTVLVSDQDATAPLLETSEKNAVDPNPLKKRKKKLENLYFLTFTTLR